MNKKHQKELQSNTKQQESFKISAKKAKVILERISQGDIFQDIEIVETVEVDKSIVTIQRISFPFVVCLNQECDLETDYKNKDQIMCDNNFLHIAIAPAFIFEQFLTGTHWGAIFTKNNPQKRKDTIIRKIIDNEIPRYHYLNFPDNEMPELIIDFKHFFSINKSNIYNQIDKRLCSLDDLFKEKISQRFSYFISRIGLRVEVKTKGKE